MALWLGAGRRRGRRCCCRYTKPIRRRRRASSRRPPRMRPSRRRHRPGHYGHGPRPCLSGAGHLAQPWRGRRQVRCQSRARNAGTGATRARPKRAGDSRTSRRPLFHGIPLAKSALSVARCKIATQHFATLIPTGSRVATGRTKGGGHTRAGRRGKWQRLETPAMRLQPGCPSCPGNQCGKPAGWHCA